MKKEIIGGMLCLCLAMGALAQNPEKKGYPIPKGAKAFVGALSFNYTQNGSYYKSARVGIGESNLFFVAKNFALGTVVGYDFTYQRNNQGIGVISKYYRHSVYAGLGMRYYKMFNERFGIYGQWSNTMTFNKTQSPLIVSLGESYTFTSTLAPNFIYFITPRLSLETGIGSVSGGMNWGQGFKAGTGTLSIGANSDIRFGLGYYIGR